METTRKILIVDDEPYAVAALERLLKEAGYCIHSAKNGADALKICPRFKPDLVLLDLMMPGLKGEEVCQAIKSASSDTKVVYFSAKQNLRSGFENIGYQPDGFIAKPATSKVILTTINSVLNGKK